MSITTVNVGTPTEAVAATTTAVPMPSSVAAGDLLVICGSVNTAGLVTNPTGWTQQVSFYSTGNTLAPDLYVGTKLATGTEGGTSVTVTHGSTVSEWVSLGIPGVDPNTPLDVTVQTLDKTTSTNTTDLSGVTVVTDEALGIYVAAANSTAATSTPPTGWTEDADRNTGTRSFTVAHKLALPPGATGTIANTWSGTQKTIGALLIIRPGVQNRRRVAAPYVPIIRAANF